MTQVKCHAKDPSTCRIHGVPATTQEKYDNTVREVKELLSNIDTGFKTGSNPTTDGILLPDGPARLAIGAKQIERALKDGARVSFPAKASIIAKPHLLRKIKQYAEKHDIQILETRQHSNRVVEFEANDYVSLAHLNKLLSDIEMTEREEAQAAYLSAVKEVNKENRKRHRRGHRSLPSPRIEDFFSNS